MTSAVDSKPVAPYLLSSDVTLHGLWLLHIKSAFLFLRDGSA